MPVCVRLLSANLASCAHHCFQSCARAAVLEKLRQRGAPNVCRTAVPLTAARQPSPCVCDGRSCTAVGLRSITSLYWNTQYTGPLLASNLRHSCKIASEAVEYIFYSSACIIVLSLIDTLFVRASSLARGWRPHRAHLPHAQREQRGGTSLYTQHTHTPVYIIFATSLVGVSPRTAALINTCVSSSVIMARKAWPLPVPPSSMPSSIRHPDALASYCPGCG